MIRQFTLAGQAADQLLRLPKQPMPYRIISLQTGVVLAGATTPLVFLCFQYAGVAAVAQIPLPAVCPTGTSTTPITFARDINPVSILTATGQGVMSQRLPDIIVTPQMEVWLTTIEADPADAFQTVNVLIEDVDECAGRKG